jgi:hypothetical protein
VVRVSIFVWLLPLDLTGKGGSTSSYATAGIALRVSGAHKPHHHYKVEIPLVGIFIMEMQCVSCEVRTDFKILFRRSSCFRGSASYCFLAAHLNFKALEANSKLSTIVSEKVSYIIVIFFSRT